MKRGVQRGILGKRGEEILKAVYFYRYMTALDVCSLLYAPSSLVYVRRILTELSGGGDYVEREFLYRFPLQRGVGNRVRVYTLGARGRDFFKHELEYPVTWYFRPDKVRHLSLGQLTHNLLLTRFLVAAKMWAESRPEFKLLQVRTCYEVGSEYPSVEVVKEGKKESVLVIPDAWLLFETVKDRVEWPILLEIDRGTAFKHKFKDHIASRIEFIKRGGVYSKLFGGEAVVIAYVTTGETKEYREARLRAMCAWAMEVLKEQGRDAWASVFRFGSIGLEDMYECTLFEKNVWYRPDSNIPIGLF